MSTPPPEITEAGFAIFPNALSPAEVDNLLAAVERVNNPGRGGIRNLLDRMPEVRALTRSPSIRRLVEPILGEHSFAARGILFDKTPEANWKGPWHQDLTIAVQDRIEATGFGPWTIKEGVDHVQPPTGILESMLAVRIHLDDCNEKHGPHKVIAGSHQMGLERRTNPITSTDNPQRVVSRQPRRSTLDATAVASRFLSGSVSRASICHSH
jgi:ectoine hydroxylase-related dioxygenase (phytanoyl-CoA dioxygenase family)